MGPEAIIGLGLALVALINVAGTAVIYRALGRVEATQEHFKADVVVIRERIGRVETDVGDLKNAA